jgi:hypothetical protein
MIECFFNEVTSVDKSFLNSRLRKLSSTLQYERWSSSLQSLQSLHRPECHVLQHLSGFKDLCRANFMQLLGSQDVILMLTEKCRPTQYETS